MKKLLVSAAVLSALAATSAEAASRVNVGIGFYDPAPVYVEPAPVYYAPPPRPVYYPWGYDRHRDYDWGYWDRGPHHRWVDRRWDRGGWVPGHWE